MQNCMGMHPTGDGVMSQEASGTRFMLRVCEDSEKPEGDAGGASFPV